VAAGKRTVVVTTAIARERVGFVWAIARPGGYQRWLDFVIPGRPVSVGYVCSTWTPRAIIAQTAIEPSTMSWPTPV
jgi:hypothetical protein